MAWNHRVFRVIGDDGQPYYEIRETHYTNDDAKRVNGWSTVASSPYGETFNELIRDLAWFLAALSKPVLDETNGQECEPAHMLADELQKWMDARADTAGEA